MYIALKCGSMECNTAARLSMVIVLANKISLF